VPLWQWPEIQELLRTGCGLSRQFDRRSWALRAQGIRRNPRRGFPTLPRVLSDFVADVSDAVANVRNRVARSVDDVFARLTGFVGDVMRSATCTKHQAAGQRGEH
jgi:hypothetical protein